MEAIRSENYSAKLNKSKREKERERHFFRIQFTALLNGWSKKYLVILYFFTSIYQYKNYVHYYDITPKKEEEEINDY